MARLSARWLAHLKAVVFGYAWRRCAVCGEWWGDQELTQTVHFDTIPGGEDDRTMLCPWCTEDGVGCVAQARGGRVHDGCEFVDTESIWPPQDGDTPPPFAGLYGSLTAVDAATVLRRNVLTYLGPDSSAADVALVNNIINPPRETDEEYEDRVTRAEDRRARHALQHNALVALHTELCAGIADHESRALVAAHKPDDDGDSTVCRACPPSTVYDEVEAQQISYLQDFPCDVWKIADALQRRPE